MQGFEGLTLTSADGHKILFCRSCGRWKLVTLKPSYLKIPSSLQLLGCNPSCEYEKRTVDINEDGEIIVSGSWHCMHGRMICQCMHVQVSHAILTLTTGYFKIYPHLYHLHTLSLPLSWSSSTSSKLADTSDFAERRGRDSRLAFDLTSSVHHVHRVKFTELSRKKILLLLFLSVHHHV